MNYHKLLKVAKKFAIKLADSIEEAPDTIPTPMDIPMESPQYFEGDEESEDARLQAYEFVSLLDGLASIKNLIWQIRDYNAALGITFEILVQLRPGVVKNAIKGMLSGNFDVATYNDFKNAFFRSAQKMNLAKQLFGIIRLIEIESLDNDDFASTKEGKILNDIKSRVRIVYPKLVNGLTYS